MFKKKDNAEVLAETLFKAVVMDDIDNCFKKESLSWETHPLFDEATCRYTIFICLSAMLAVALTGRAEMDISFENVIFHFRQLVLDEARYRWDITDLKLDKAIEINADNLAQLIFIEPETNRGLTFDWATEWLSRFGVEEYNPMTLFMISNKWKTSYISLAKMLETVNI